MQRFRRILVGVDIVSSEGTAATELPAPTRAAIERALWLASRQSAEVAFLAVLDQPPRSVELLADPGSLVSPAARDAARNVVERIVEQAAKAGVRARGLVSVGAPWEEIVREVQQGPHDLVVVGTRNRSRIGRLLFGSTGMKLLRHCPCPVMVCRPDPTPEDLRFLVASDFSPLSRTALEIAVGGAQLCGAKLYLVHAFEDPLMHAAWRAGLSEAELAAARQKEHARLEQALHAQLDGTDWRTLPHGVQVRVLDGPPDLVLLDLIEEEQIDMLVLGSTARAGLGGLVLGNTAERLLAQVPCSVLVVKPPAAT